ncbi:ATP phosphoribosyltransferase regulatory subunit, partial [Dehalococcoides mccartyi]
MIARCKGCSDLLPEDMLRFRYIESIFHDSCITWGYEEVRTPMLEYLSLFTSSGTLTPQMLKRVYSFLDWDGWSGERVVLRPDGTIPAARLYIDSLQEMEVARLCYTSNIFRFDETGKKSRENWQLGAELIGVTSPEANAELITLALETLARLGFEDVELRLSHAQLIKAVLAQLEPNADEQHKIFDQLLDGDIALMSRLETEKPELFRTLKLLMENKGTSASFLKNVMAMAGTAGGELEEPLNDFIAGVDVLDKLGVSYQIDLASGKGFEYYTGVIFHLFVNGEHVGGGGRYDKLIPLLGGPDKPAAGFALYLNRLIP